MSRAGPSLFCPRGEFAELYRDRPTMVLVSSDPIGPDRLAPWMCDLDVRILSITAHDGDWLVSDARRAGPSSEDAPPTRLSSTLSSIWMIVALNDAAFAAACAFKADLSADETLEVRRASSADDPVLAVELLKACLTDRAGLLEHNHVLLLQTASLRQQFESLVRIPAEVTEVLHGLRLSGPRQVFSNETGPSAEDAGAPTRPAVETPAGGLRQPIPVHARGLAGIDLHLASSHAGGAGALVADLEALDAADTLASWRIPLNDLGAGWISLWMKTPSSLMHRRLELWLRGSGDVTPALSVRPVSPFPEYSLRVAEGDSGGEGDGDGGPVMLALRVWGGLPGVVAPENPVFAPRFRIPVSRRAILAAEMPRPPSGSESLSALPAGGLRLRGAPGRPTGVRLATPVSAEVRAIGCRAKLFNVPAGEPIMCRLVVAPAGRDFEDVLMARDVIAAGDWVQVRNNDDGQVLLLELPLLHETSVDFYALCLVDEVTLVNRPAIDFNHWFVETQATRGDPGRRYLPLEPDGEQPSLPLESNAP